MASHIKYEKDHQVREAMRTLLQASTPHAERREVFDLLLASENLTTPLLPALFSSLHNKPPELQQIAFDLAVSLEAKGNDIACLAAELASHLTSAYVELREQATEMLEHMGREAKPAEDFALGCLRNKDRAVALSGLRILHAIDGALSRGIGARISAVTELFPNDPDIGELARQVRALVDAPSGSMRRLAQEVRAHLSGKRILVVDDNAPYRQMLVAALREADALVSEAETGQAALQLLQPEHPQDRFDLLLLDIRLPDISGLQILSTLRQHNIHLPVVAISGINNDSIIHAANALGVHHYVLKSTGLGVLLRIATTALEEYSK